MSSGQQSGSEVVNIRISPDVYSRLRVLALSLGHPRGGIDETISYMLDKLGVELPAVPNPPGEVKDSKSKKTG